MRRDPEPKRAPSRPRRPRERRKLPELSPEVIKELREKFKDWKPPEPPPVAQSYYCDDCGTLIKPKKCSCGKIPKVKASKSLFPVYYVQCVCGEQSWGAREYPAQAIKCWNKESHTRSESDAKSR